MTEVCNLIEDLPACLVHVCMRLLYLVDRWRSPCHCSLSRHCLYMLKWIGETDKALQEVQWRYTPPAYRDLSVWWNCSIMSAASTLEAIWPSSCITVISSTGWIMTRLRVERYVKRSVFSLWLRYLTWTFLILPSRPTSTDWIIPYWYVEHSSESCLRNRTISPSLRSLSDLNHLGCAMSFGTCDINQHSNHDWKNSSDIDDQQPFDEELWSRWREQHVNLEEK